VHVAGRVDLHQQRDERYDDEHQSRKEVVVHPEGQLERVELEPDPVLLDNPGPRDEVNESGK
jgi:hypothetical protein